MVGSDGLHGALHDGGIGAVAGKGQDPGLGTGGHQKVIILHIVIAVAVMQLHGAHRPRHHRQRQPVTEEIKGGICRTVFTDGVHIDTQLLPLLIVADKTGTQSLGAGAGNGVFAGQTVADLAGLAVRPDLSTGMIENLLISHTFFLAFKSLFRAWVWLIIPRFGKDARAFGNCFVKILSRPSPSASGSSTPACSHRR